MKLFARSTADNLAAARQSLAAAEAKIAELETQRTLKLPDADITELQKIDSELATHRQAASIYRDRVASLINRRRQEERERLEREKADEIAEVEKRLARRDTAARCLETALAEVCGAYAELAASDEAIFPSQGSTSYLSIFSMSLLCRRSRRTTDPIPRNVIGPVRAIADGAGAGLADEIQQKGRDLLDLMQTEPITEPGEGEDDDTEVAA